MKPIKLGVSSCLMGQEVRFDGGHKKSTFITNVLADEFDLVSLCPEVAIGLGVPRQTLRIVGDEKDQRVIGNKDSSLDVTHQLRTFAHSVLEQLEGICGYIVKKDSPSCGMERVRVYGEDGIPQRNGRGAYIDELMQLMPWLPVEEEGRLNDPRLREIFFERVFVVARWREMEQEGVSAKSLVRFHSAHKYMLMSRGQHEYRRLGRIVANAGRENINQLAREYFLNLMDVLKKQASRGRHSDVMFHLLGYFKKVMKPADKQELISLIENYRQGLLPLIIPVTLMSHHLKMVNDDYLKMQHYFSPYPERLMLRNLV